MPDPLEQELATLTPIPPSNSLDAAIAHTLSNSEFRVQNSEFRPSPSLSDRILLSTLSLAAAAALLILTLLTTDYLNTPTTSSPPPSAQASFAQTQQLLAQLTNESTTNILPTPQSTQPHFNTQ